MRIGILSDIHGNREALEMVLAHFEKSAPDLLVCLGDIVGYGAEPDECVERVFDTADIIVRGNHDTAVVDDSARRLMNHYAAEAIAWTANRLSAVNRGRLAALPVTAERDNLFFVHASPNHPEHWNYLFPGADPAEAFSALQQRWCFIGHTHMPAVFTGSGIHHATGNRIALPENDRYIINAGSVGQPRDGDPRACVAEFDTETMILTFRRLPYNLQTAAEKIINAGLPEFLARRLYNGC